MSTKNACLTRHYCLLVIAMGSALILPTTAVLAAEAEVPAGFRALFNGKDLTGWYGLNPHAAAKLSGEEKARNLRKQRDDFASHWRVEQGQLVNDGQGPYATTEADFGDIELRLEYRTVPRADSGIYLRGTPQVQIWDWNQPFDPNRPTRKPHLGSGGLFNNSTTAPGRDPLVFADRPFGQWNQVRIRQIGAVTWVWLNDQLVVDAAVMENYWDRSQPLPSRGPVMLQTHGGEIRWRNIYVREIAAAEAEQWLASTVEDSLRSALTLHASFDHGLDADFSRGDRTSYVKRSGQLLRAQANEDVELDPEAGRFGGALRFTRKSKYQPAFQNSGILDYNQKSWSGAVSLWLKLDPDQDLEPGYCDPVQIIGGDTKKGFIFLEFSKDETPRLFRYAVRPLIEIWNPRGVAWDELPADARPMVEVAEAPFSRDAWTHVLFCFHNVNSDEEPSGQLFLNGQLAGEIQGWDLTFGWKPQNVLLVLGASYVGLMDDLAVFNRSLTPAEAMQIYRLKQGIAQLR